MNGEEYLDFFGWVYRLHRAARKQRSRYLLEYFGIAEAAGSVLVSYVKVKWIRKFRVENGHN